MADKVQKIREEVQKIARSINPYIPDEEGKNSEYEAGRFAMVTQIMQIIDSMQEEPARKSLDYNKLKTMLDNALSKETTERWNERLDKKCMYSNDNYTDEDRKVLCDGCEEKCKFNKKEEPVSEDLEEAVNAYIGYAPEVDESSSTYGKRQAFKAGAQWKEQQLVAKAVKVKISNAGIVSLPSDCDLKVGDKVLIIKEK